MCEDFERSLRLIRSGAIDCETFVDTRFSLTDGDDPFKSFLKSETCKPVFDVSVLREA